MDPGTCDLSMRRGDSFRQRFVLYEDTAQTQPTDLTGYQASAQIRDNTEAALRAVFTVTIELPNTLVLVLPSAMSMKLQPGTAVWDLELTAPDGWVSTVVAGSVLVAPDVTKVSA